MSTSLITDIFEQLPGYIGWKDNHFHYLGCNQNLATVLGLSKSSKIIGLKDNDLIDHTDESSRFHYENDLMVLQGKTVTGIHQSSGPYQGAPFYFVKKPLYDVNNNICGILYHCNQFITTKMDSKFLITEDARHYRNQLPANPFKLSNRELECLFYALRGKTAKEISQAMTLSKRTIESYLDSIKNKTGCKNKADLLVLAVSKGYMNYIPPHILSGPTV